MPGIALSRQDIATETRFQDAGKGISGDVLVLLGEPLLDDVAEDARHALGLVGQMGGGNFLGI